MLFTETSSLTQQQKEAVLQLWDNEYPKDIALGSIQKLEEYLDKTTQHHHIFLLDKNETIVGWFFAFIRDSERWFAIIVNSKKQGKGLGSALLEKGKTQFNELNGWVVTNTHLTKADGHAYLSPLGFYQKHGFAVLENETFETEIMKTVKIRWCRTSDESTL